MTTIQDVMDNTPEGQRAVEKAMRESIEDQNKMIKQAQSSPVEEKLGTLIDKIYDYGWEMGRDSKTDGTFEKFNLAEAKTLLLRLINEERENQSKLRIDENTSDGYHTFKELYKFRLLYNAALFNEIQNYESQYGGTVKPVKSWKHSDGKLAFGGGWFVVSAQLPTGQITNHYEEKDWDLFRIPEVNEAPEWDGHTPQDVAERLKAYLLLPSGVEETDK